MAIDEAILLAVSARRAPPTLRFYAWNPPCLSLGYGQHVSDVDDDRLEAAGWDVVRRATGGRAILHTDELTYSVALPDDDALAAGSVVESYRRISRALVCGLEQLGVKPEADKRSDRPDSAGPVCFETPSHYEITIGGRKLVGSAQVRRKQGVLQHGSLPLVGDLGRICDALVYINDAEREAAKAQVRARAVTLEQVLGSRAGARQLSWHDAAKAMAQGFAEAFGVAFASGALSDDERAEAERLAAEVYGNEAHTRRR